MNVYVAEFSNEGWGADSAGRSINESKPLENMQIQTSWLLSGRGGSRGEANSRQIYFCGHRSRDYHVTQTNLRWNYEMTTAAPAAALFCLSFRLQIVLVSIVESVYLLNILWVQSVPDRCTWPSQIEN